MSRPGLDYVHTSMRPLPAGQALAGWAAGAGLNRDMMWEIDRGCLHLWTMWAILIIAYYIMKYHPIISMCPPCVRETFPVSLRRHPNQENPHPFTRGKRKWPQCMTCTTAGKGSNSTRSMVCFVVIDSIQAVLTSLCPSSAKQFSILSATSFLVSGLTWAYTARVVRISLCPKRSATAFRLAPASKHSVV